MCNNFLEKLEDMGAEVEDTLERLMGDEDMYLEYLIRFSNDPNLPALIQAVEDQDAENAMIIVHTLKGVALNLGLLPLVDVCMDMLLDFRTGKNEDAFSRIDSIKQAFNDFSEFINACK